MKTSLSLLGFGLKDLKSVLSISYIWGLKESTTLRGGFHFGKSLKPHINASNALNVVKAIPI